MSEEGAPKKKFELSSSVAILASGVLIAAAIVYVNLHPAAPSVAVDNQLPASVNISAPNENDHIRGSLSAPVVLVEYSDFQCPYCERVNPTIKQIVDESNGSVAWVYRQLPLESLHPQARPAALASECIAEQLGNDGFWKFADAIFADQSKMSPDYYEQLAVQFGADKAQYEQCISSGKYANKIDAQAAEAMQNGMNGTPSTVVVGNGKQVLVSGAQPYANFMAVIKAVQARQQ